MTVNGVNAGLEKLLPKFKETSFNLVILFFNSNTSLIKNAFIAINYGVN